MCRRERVGFSGKLFLRAFDWSDSLIVTSRYFATKFGLFIPADYLLQVLLKFWQPSKVSRIFRSATLVWMGTPSNVRQRYEGIICLSVLFQ